MSIPSILHVAAQCSGVCLRAATSRCTRLRVCLPVANAAPLVLYFAEKAERDIFLALNQVSYTCRLRLYSFTLSRSPKVKMDAESRPLLH